MAAQGSAVSVIAPFEAKSARRVFVYQRGFEVSTVHRRLGLIQTVNLCFKHMPPPSQRPYVHDLVCLRKLIAHNLAQGFGGAKSSIVSYNSDSRSF